LFFGIVTLLTFAGARVESADYSYGSDKHGLVWGYRFTPGGEISAINSEQAAAWLATNAEGSEDGFLWLHFSLANAATVGWLQRNIALNDAFYESLNEQASSTRIELEGEMLVAVVHDALFDFTFDPQSVSTVNLCMTPRSLVTARLRPVRSVDLLRGAVRAGEEFRSPADMLAHLLQLQASVLTDIERTSSRRVDAIEDKLLANRIATSRRELGALRRTHVRLQRLLAPEPASLFRLLTRSPKWIGADDLQDLRQAGEEFAAAVADSSALVERVKLLQEELASMVEERTSRTLFVLTLVTVLALPINLVAGLFGMNVGGIPYSQHPHGFALIVGTLILVSIVAGYLALRSNRD
jgi:zinc transporter